MPAGADTHGEVLDPLAAGEPPPGPSDTRGSIVDLEVREQLGPDRPLRTEGRNLSEPIEPETVGGEDNPEGRARNRRVEISFDEPQG